jgi:hypothetical protein
MMADIHSELQRDVYIGQVAKELDVTRDRLDSTVAAIRKKRVSGAKKRETHNLAVFAQDKSEPGGKRRENPNAAGFLAEENLIAMLMAHPDYMEAITALTAEDFFDGDHRQIYHVISGRIRENLSLEPIHLSASLTPSQMGRLSRIMEKGRELKFYPSQADEYSQAILKQKEVKSASEVGTMSPEEYDRYIASLTVKKK